MTAAMAHQALVDDVRARLRAAGDPVKAPAMQAYMKSPLPYHGVASPQARVIFREVLAVHPLPDRESWLATALALWDEATHREEWYAALAVVRSSRYAAHRDTRALGLYRHFLTTGAWWDVVDDVAIHLVGPLLIEDPNSVAPVLREWATDDNRWLRRTAVIAQVGAKDRTDTDLLSHVIEANLEDRDFFLRKAIGWALRQHARTDPDWVRAFVAAHDDRISKLSSREALKHLAARPLVTGE
jgi:3-methyladenine DNA glycosylase AlkD